MEAKINKISVCMIAVLFAVFTIWVWVKPDTEFSSTERRTLKKFPECSIASIADGKFMEQFEAYATDQFPFRDAFRSLKAAMHFYLFGQSDNNDVYVIDGHIGKIDYPYSEKAVKASAKKFNSIYEKYISGTDASVYYAIVPDKHYFLGEKNGYPAYDYKEMYETLATELSDMEYIEIADMLSVEDYYRTDTHWKQESITDVAKRLAESMGVTLQEEYTEVTHDGPFYGVYYGQLGLPVEPDTITYLVNPMFEDCVVTNHETGKTMSVYDLAKAEGRDPYELFLSGSISAITIENPNATTDKELVMFRDSFGSSLAPLLVEAYAKITILDARYMNEIMIGKFVTFENQDVLFIHSTGVLNNETAFQ